jgi:hypothetical protein
MSVSRNLCGECGQANEVGPSRHDSFAGFDSLHYLYIASLSIAQPNRPPLERLSPKLNKDYGSAGVIDDGCLGDSDSFRQARNEQAERDRLPDGQQPP